MDKKNIVIGILAHVDAGKTTLAESILYHTGTIRNLGRVDHKDAYLDTFSLERERGITIFSKQAQILLGHQSVTLLDTPGHVDFSTEMERTLRVLDYGILVISASAGITGHTITVWKLLQEYNIPVFIFVNKMDQDGANKGSIMSLLQKKLFENCIDFSESLERKSDEEEFQRKKLNDIHENIAVTSELAMEEYLDTNSISQTTIATLIQEREIIPCFFGSALKLEGVESFLEGMKTYINPRVYPEAFSAQVFKVARDAKGNRLTYVKITGGTLEVKDKVYKKNGECVCWENKIDQIRVYTGPSFETKSLVEGGAICAVTGLEDSKVGDGLGEGIQWELPRLSPVIYYTMEFDAGINVHTMYVQLLALQEEEPTLEFEMNPVTKAIQAKVMGEVQLEILEAMIKERYQVGVEFTSNTIIYKETIKNPVLGIGHFEPLKHYAEVHLLIEPGALGSGVVYQYGCTQEECPLSYQHLIMTHLTEITHPGVLIGADITDISITIVAGRGHVKHTEGGDFREATYRALQQGLMQADSVLLEPVYGFVIEVPVEYLGRVISDIGLMKGEFLPPEVFEDRAVISGKAPVSAMNGYHQEVVSYTKGFGQCQLFSDGYLPVAEQEAVIESQLTVYHREEIFTPDSVFCKQGAGFCVPWNEVHGYAHIETKIFTATQNIEEEYDPRIVSQELWIDQEEIDEIMGRGYKNAGKKHSTYKQKPKSPISVASGDYVYAPKPKTKEYLLVDGYNIIFAWDELKELAVINIDGAREKLLSLLSNYQGYKNNVIIVVFDAYKVKRNLGEVQQYHNVTCVYTKEAESADAYIEQVAHQMSGKENVVVATSDVVEQLIIMGQGARKMSAKQLLEELIFVEKELKTNFLTNNMEQKFHTLGEVIQEQNIKTDN